MEILIQTDVKPTESKEKVLKCLHNLFPAVKFDVQEGKISGRSKDLSALERLKQLLGRQAIRDAARAYLQKNIFPGELKFWLNKQAASCSVVNFTEGESPLGPITVTVRAKDVQKVVDYLTGSEKR